MDQHLKTGYEEGARDETGEIARAANIRTDSGEILRVYPITKIALGQAVVLVADEKVFCLEAVWEDMAEKDKDRFR